MEVAYVIGPYRSSDGVFGIVKNIRRAEELAITLWRLGYAVICPHKNTALFDGAALDEVWLEGDKELLGRSDFAVTVGGWEGSSGARVEVDLCRALRKRVFTLEELVRERHPERLKEFGFKLA